MIEIGEAVSIGCIGKLSHRLRSSLPGHFSNKVYRAYSNDEVFTIYANLAYLIKIKVGYSSLIFNGILYPFGGEP